MATALPDRCYDAFVNYYDVLGITSRASVSDIRAAFRKRALESHPDRNENSTSFDLHLEAADVLSNPVTRCEFDSLLETHFPLPSNLLAPNVEPLTKSSNESAYKRMEESFKAMLSSDDTAALDAEKLKIAFITLEQVNSGCELDDGLKIPKGVLDKTRFRVNGSVVMVRVLPHPRFVRGGTYSGTTLKDLIVFAAAPSDVHGVKFLKGVVKDLTGRRQIWYSIDGYDTRIKGAGLPSIDKSEKCGDVVIKIIDKNRNCRKTIKMITYN